MEEQSKIVKFRLDIARVIEILTRTDEELLEMQMSPPDEKTSADCLDAIWWRLNTFISGPRFVKLLDWAGKEIGYKYHSPSTPHDSLRDYVRDKLRDLNEKHLAELEAILE